MKYILIILATLSFQACFLSPGNGYVLEDSNDLFFVDGFDREPGDEILIQAYNPCELQWQTIAEVTTDTIAFTQVKVDKEIAGTDEDAYEPIYRWGQRIRVPAQYWSIETDGRYSTRLMAKLAHSPRLIIERGPLKSFDVNWTDCFSSSSGEFDFYQNCPSANSPEMVIYAKNHYQERAACCNIANLEESSVNGRLAQDILSQFKEPNGIDIRQPTGSFRVSHPGFPKIRELLKKPWRLFRPFRAFGELQKAHIQGVARFRDYRGMQRVAITDTHTGGLIMGYGRSVEDLSMTKQVQIRHLPEYGNYDHPGGIQAQGDLVAVAMEDGDSSFTAVYFLKAEGLTVNFIQWVPLDGRNGEPRDKIPTNIFGVGFIQLSGGNFLMAVSGKNNQVSHGIWFYESNGSSLTEAITWRYTGIYEPSCVTNKPPFDNCFMGAGGGVNLVSDERGRIFIFAMNGSGTGDIDFSQEYHSLEVLQYSRPACGEISLSSVIRQYQRVGLIAARDISFRWAGGVYVEDDGSLMIMNTERRTRQRNNDYTDGNLFSGN